MIQLIHLLVLNFLIVISLNQKAYLLTSSVGYYNYRQQANVMQVYQLIKKYGYQDQDVLLNFPENVGCSPKNSLQGSVSFRDQDYTNLNRNIEVDYKYDVMSSESVANSMVMKYRPETLNLKRLKFDNEPYFLYLTGHGGNYYFKIREREALIVQNFRHIFRDLSKRRPKMPVFVLIDSCSAITPYEEIDEPNIIALASSSLDEESLSKGYDKILNSPKSDEFTWYLSEYLEDFNPTKKNTTIKHLYEYMDVTKLKVHAKIVSSNKQNKLRYLHEFMTKKPKIHQSILTLTAPESFLPHQ